MLPSEELKQFQETLRGAKSLLILMPENPDLDTVAAGTSLLLSLRGVAKDVTIACPSPMIVEFNRLVGVDKVRQNLGNKNLVISFENYRPEDIDKVKYDIENGEFYLTVAPKSGATPPRKEQIKADYGGVAADAVILVNVEERERLGKFASKEEIFDQGRKIISLGNVPSRGLRGIEVVDTQAACVSEVAARVIEESNLPLDSDLARNLLSGLRGGTSNFQSQAVTADTFAVASRLMRISGETPPEGQQQGQVGQQGEVPQDWKEPKVYKGSTLP